MVYVSFLGLLFLLEHEKHAVRHGKSSKDIDGSHRNGDASQDVGSGSSWGTDHEDTTQNDDSRQTVAGTHERTEQCRFHGPNEIVTAGRDCKKSL